MLAVQERNPRDVESAATTTRWSVDALRHHHDRGHDGAWTSSGGRLFLEHRPAQSSAECLGGGARHIRGSFCNKGDLGLFDALRAEIFTGVRPWSGNWRPVSDGKWRTPWRSGMGSEQVEDLEGNVLPAHSFVLRKLASLMNAEVQMWWTNFYEDGSVGCEFHHDGHAEGNVTVGASFGGARDLTFKHASTGQDHSFLQENGDVFAFNEKVDCTYMHGVYPVDEKVGPRISVILFGKTRTDAQISPEALEALMRLLQNAYARPKERARCPRPTAAPAPSPEAEQPATQANVERHGGTTDSAEAIGLDGSGEVDGSAALTEHDALLAVAEAAWPELSDEERAAIRRDIELARLAGFAKAGEPGEATSRAVSSLSRFLEAGKAAKSAEPTKRVDVQTPGCLEPTTVDHASAMIKLPDSAQSAESNETAKFADSIQLTESTEAAELQLGSSLVKFLQKQKLLNLANATRPGGTADKLAELVEAVEALPLSKVDSVVKPAMSTKARKRAKAPYAAKNAEIEAEPAKAEPAEAEPAKAVASTPSTKLRPPPKPPDADVERGVGRELVGTWFTYNSRYIGAFDVREAPTGRVFLEQLLPTGSRLSGCLRRDGEWLQTELRSDDGSPSGSVRLRVQPGQDGPAVLLMHFARGGGEVRAERSEGAYFVDNRALQAETAGLEYCSSRQLDDAEVPPRLANWGTTVQGVDQGDGWLRVGIRGEAGRHFLPMIVQGLTVLVPRSRLWRCQPVNSVPVPIRTVADLDGPLTGESLTLGEVFEVSCTRKGLEGDTYLKLADGRGWVSSRNPSYGTGCVFHGFGDRPPAPAPASRKPEASDVGADGDLGDEREGARRRRERRRLEAAVKAAKEQEPAPPPAADWTCPECGFDAPGAERVCPFCDTPRGEGARAVALRS